jgi:hypothetical protein
MHFHQWKRREFATAKRSASERRPTPLARADEVIE